jgi:hypothetical protein
MLPGLSLSPTSLPVSSYGAYGTTQYDSFQWYTNGIMP